MEKYYNVLGISVTADKDQIKVAYKKLCKMYNEDLFLDNKNYQDKAKEIHYAYGMILKSYQEVGHDITLYISLIIKNISLLTYFDDALKNKYNLRIKSSKTKEEVEDIYEEAIEENIALKYLSEYKKEMILNITKLTFVSLIVYSSKIKLCKIKEEVDELYRTAIRENKIQEVLNKLDDFLYLDENQYYQYKKAILDLEEISKIEFILTSASELNDNMSVIVANKRNAVIKYLTEKENLRDKKDSLITKAKTYCTIKKLDEIVFLADLYSQLFKLPKELMLEIISIMLQKTGRNSFIYEELSGFYEQILRLESGTHKVVREKIRLSTVNYDQLFKSQPFKVHMSLDIEIKSR